MNPTATKILARHDAGKDAAAIAATLSVSASYVYSVLREHRPDRKRKAHPKRSDEPGIIVGMFDQGHKPARIAISRGISRAYVYRVLVDADRL